MDIQRRDREEDLPSDGSLPTIRSQEPLLGLPRGCRVPKLWAVLDCFPGHRQGAGWEAGPPGLEPAPTWDPGRARRRHKRLPEL